MPYQISGHKGGPCVYTTESPTDAIKKALELIAKGAQNVTIADGQGKYYRSHQFDQLLPQTGLPAPGVRRRGRRKTDR